VDDLAGDESIYVHHAAIGEQRSAPITDYLPNSHGQPTVCLFGEADRRHGWIDRSPLPCPVGTDGIVTSDIAALPSVRPFHIRRETRKDGIDVTRVERRVEALNVGLLFAGDMRLTLRMNGYGLSMISILYPSGSVTKHSREPPSRTE
jgi:hypothetical protein